MMQSVINEDEEKDNIKEKRNDSLKNKQDFVDELSEESSEELATEGHKVKHWMFAIQPTKQLIFNVKFSPKDVK